jgi:RNA recognition motif-containing protein
MSILQMNSSRQQHSEQDIYHITVPEYTIPPPPAPPLPPASLGNNSHLYSNLSQQQLQQQQQQQQLQLQANITSNVKPAVRIAAGKKWVDPKLSEYPENDYRLFVGNLDKVINEQKLAEAFQSRYPSFAMCRIVYDKTTGMSKGYGFVSLMDAKDCARAIREMDQSWLGSRPIKVKKSDWQERDFKQVQKQLKKNKKKHS